MLRIGIDIGGCSITSETEIHFETVLRTAGGKREYGTFVLIWTLAMILSEADALWQCQHGPSPAIALAPAPGGQIADLGTLPDPHRWAVKAVQALIEVHAGRRPVHQLRPLTSPQLLADLSRRASVTRPLMAISTLRVSQPSADVAEVSAVLCNGGRARAIAMRLEARKHKWQISALSM